MNSFRALSATQWLITSAVWLAVVAGGAWTWAAARPRVIAVSDEGSVVFADRTHLNVFGADVTFMLVTSAIALATSVAVVSICRGRSLTPIQIVLGAGLQFFTSVAIMFTGPLVDSVSRSAQQVFPPELLPSGRPVVEPARIHAYGSLLLSSLVWLVAILVSSALKRNRESATTAPA